MVSMIALSVVDHRFKTSGVMVSVIALSTVNHGFRLVE
jgi:hypothetical protein